MKKIAVFDMDGTILDTLTDLMNSMNETLVRFGFPVHTYDEIRMFVGNGIPKLVERSVPAGTDKDVEAEVLEAFKVYYGEHCADETRPYEGIPELIRKLREQGILTAVVSNKADFAVQKLCEDYFPGLFDAAAGDQEGKERKPAPDLVFEVLKKLGAAPEDGYYIGDSDVDVATAANSGMECIAVTWGFRDREFLIAHGATRFAEEPKDILDYYRG